MAGQVCKCLHEKRDHKIVSAAMRGACSICLCEGYKPETPRQAKPVATTVDDQNLSRPVRNSWIIS
jgi:hypothetical protein